MARSVKTGAVSVHVVVAERLGGESPLLARQVGTVSRRQGCSP